MTPGEKREFRRRDRLTVTDTNENERTVFGWVTVERESFVRGSNPVVDHVETHIYSGDSETPVKTITHWVAEELEAGFGIDAENHGIDVIDVTKDEVRIL